MVLGTQLEYGFMYLRVTHISVHTGKTDLGFTQPLQAQTHTDTCVDLMPWLRDGGCLRSAEGLGAGRLRTEAHLRDGNLPLQRMALFLQEGPGTWMVSLEAALQARVSAEPSMQSQPPASPRASSRPSYLSPLLPLLPSCCSNTALQPCQPLPGQDVSSLLACLPVPTLRSSSLSSTR